MSTYIAASYSSQKSNQGAFSFRSIIKNDQTADGLTLLEWLNNNELISLHNHNTDGTTHSLSFSLAGPASDYFPLLRSIILLGLPNSFTLNAAVQSRSFNLQWKEPKEPEVRNYLVKVLDLISAEIRFKQVLRKVIANQEKFEKEERLLFNSL
ncbi:MAG TPA: hypothetical protein VK014_01565 [Cyclobacteriaceae bacterium]|nr:hypothetical protein [Cyclobacteriaceae bacterium]